MTDLDGHSARITTDNPALSSLKLAWGWAEFSAEDGIGPLSSMYEAGDALVAVGQMNEDGMTILGSGVMVAPGMLLTATHVLDEFAQEGRSPLFFTFLPGKARAWLPHDVVTISGEDKFDDRRKIVSDLSLVGVTLNSDAHDDFPLNLAAMQVALPLLGERLWAIGFRHHSIENGAAHVAPMVSSGLVTAVFPSGRGSFLASACVEVNMDTLGGMSGGAVVNSEARVVGIVSTSFEGGLSYITLIWEALRLEIAGAVPDLQTRKKVSLKFAASKGLARLLGNVEEKPWGDVIFSFSDKESELFASSLSGEAAEKMRRKLVRNDVDTFLDEFGRENGGSCRRCRGRTARGTCASQASRFAGSVGDTAEASRAHRQLDGRGLRRRRRPGNHFCGAGRPGHSSHRPFL
ncbi:serine protease [Neorhizobium sp. T7_12]|uniref:trypsin-like serine peptidase n=1 Tax=Neorhizobium sp. T7_12 TaxID=2093832 RepID=UPI00155E4154|nr:serine protease [Neorhizobium sp. T7_12]